VTASRRDPPVYLYDPDRCPFTATWSVIGEKWKGILWWRLSKGLGRFGELQRAIPQISKKMLTQQLREMERDGIVHRREHSTRLDRRSNGDGRYRTPLRVEYSLTEYGRSLEPVIAAICKWGGGHLRRKSNPPRTHSTNTTLEKVTLGNGNSNSK
jgi:DNA-binding HxlR family transcriptional regulator